MDLIFVTGNENKRREVAEILGPSVSVSCVSLNLPEYQGDSRTVAAEKCLLAVRTLESLGTRPRNAGIFTEDTCLCFTAYGGLPGPYVKWFHEQLGPAGLHRMLAGFEDKSASALTTIAFLPPGQTSDPILFEGITKGTIVEPRGGAQFGWDPIFQPADAELTYAEMSKQAKNCVSHRAKALAMFQAHLAEFLATKNKTVPAN